VVICLERGADLHMAQLMPLPLTVSCFSKIQIGFAFLVLAHPGSPGQRAVKRVCVCVCVLLWWQVAAILRLSPQQKFQVYLLVVPMWWQVAASERICSEIKRRPVVSM